ncbi:MAG: FAD:protein FMN transferase [Zoogloea sp.]|uniref:FAD:protein FMN transferase n=1 Tax=Zoogloea sp. TaxID=49181 RepID=UPI0026086429|nr:FAD:protein FMN transferase [Zoogloea sp.]MDD3326883.1 FAD:protein FMN transferase [Zoogloea sp.]
MTPPAGSLRAAGARLLALLALVALLAGCGRERLHQQESYVFGTRVELLTWDASEDKARSAMAEVLREFDRLHRAYHAWEPSELTALNTAIAAGKQGIPVSPELAAMLADAQQLAATGDQLFNPALGQLIALWGFHTDTFTPHRPDPARLAALVAAHPQMADLTIAGTTVTSRNPAVQLDLGGYGKGYALDRAAAILKARGVGNALINIGGNVLALGSKGEAPWRVGIQHPREPRPLASLPLRDGEAIGTSGDYQRFFEMDGERYCHLLDPRSGRPARGTQAVTVLITPRPGAGTLSDAASKPVYLGGDAWRDYARRFGIEHALRVDAAGRIQVTRPLHDRLQYGDGIPPPSVVD